ncbi:MAG: DUF374 domain-containing protein [Ignavibacteria bacterium]|nr:DUF374 domain-containing protein [Ignavibacteria bacterium]
MKAWLLSLVIRMIARTWRLSVTGRLPTGPSIVAFWHGEMLPVWFVFRALRPVALVSSSKDGSLLSRLLKDWGYDVILGSSSKGGKEALEQLVAEASSRVVLLTPDGPRGPAHQAKPGAVIAAHRAHVPLVLVRIHAKSAHTFVRSWDRFILPLPFTNIELTIDHNWVILADATREELDTHIKYMDERMRDLVKS